MKTILLDRLLATETDPTVCSAMRRATPFVLDREAFKTVLDMRANLLWSKKGRGHRKLVLPDLARVPFEETWLEYELGDSGLRMGHFIIRDEERGYATVIAEDAYEIRIMPFSVEWTLSPEKQTEWRLHTANDGPTMGRQIERKFGDYLLSQMLLGKQSYKHFRVPPWSRRMGGILTVRDAVKYAQEDYEKCIKDIEDSAGFLSTLMTALALIAWCPVEYVKHAPKGRFVKRGRTFPYRVHSTVHLTIPIHTIYRHLIRGQTEIHHRRHKVREHLRVLHRGLPNEQVIIIAEHERGDATLGYVVHDYDVTGRP